MRDCVYFDNAATTKIKSAVLEAMMPYLTEEYGNPSSIYSLGARAHSAIDEARDQVARAIGAKGREVFFTGGGTEADNWAIKGVALGNRKKGNHIISTAIEHHAVLHTLDYLEKQGFEVTYLPVDEYGRISPEDVKNAIKDTTILITVMFANNEIGVIEPIGEIGAIAKEKGIAFHTDAVQALGHMPIDVNTLNIDLMSLSAHKIHGPKGVGALYVRQGLRMENFLHGGAQEQKRRSGTENVAGIVGFGKAIQLATADIAGHTGKIAAMRDRLIDEIYSRIPYCRLNGPRDGRVCNNVNFSFQYIEGEALLLMLNMKGVAASSGSACTSGSLDPSHVLLAIGLPHEIAHGSLRLSLSDYTTQEDIDYVLEVLPPIVARLRAMSPLYEEIERGVKYV